jgi:hypothetical protein
MGAVRRVHELTAGIAAFAFALLVGAAAAQAAPAKSTQNEGEWVKYDPAAQIVVVKITKAGKGPNSKMVKAGEEVTFKVKAEGSVLTRTTVKINGKKAELTDIPEGKTVLIRWIPDEAQKGAYFARGVDVIFSEKELEERYGAEKVD